MAELDESKLGNIDPSDGKEDGVHVTPEQVCPHYAELEKLLRDAAIPAEVKEQAEHEVRQEWNTVTRDAYAGESVDIWKMVVATNLARLRKQQVVHAAVTQMVAATVCAALSQVGDDPCSRAEQFRSALHAATSLPRGVGITSAEVASHAPQHVYALVATSKPISTLYVAFRGTKNFADVNADLSFLEQLSAPNGRVHKGLAAQAESLYGPAVLAWCGSTGGLPGLQHPVKRVVLCGHSLGGAVASIAMLRTRLYLERSGAHAASTSAVNTEPTSLQCDDVVCITFGAPWWCDATVRNAIDQRGWTSGYLNFVDFADPVPNLVELHDALQPEPGMARQAAEASAHRDVEAEASPYMPVGTFCDITREDASARGTRLLTAEQAMRSAERVEVLPDNVARHEMLGSYLGKVLATVAIHARTAMTGPLPAEVIAGRTGQLVPRLNDADEVPAAGVSGLLEAISPVPVSGEAERARAKLRLTFSGSNMMSVHTITIHNRTCRTRTTCRTV